MAVMVLAPMTCKTLSSPQAAPSGQPHPALTSSQDWGGSYFGFRDRAGVARSPISGFNLRCSFCQHLLVEIQNDLGADIAAADPDHIRIN